MTNWVSIDVPMDEIMLSMGKSEMKELLDHFELDEIATIKDFLDHYDVEDVLETIGERVVKRWISDDPTPKSAARAD